MAKSESTLQVMQHLTLMATWCWEQDCCRGQHWIKLQNIWTSRSDRCKGRSISRLESNLPLHTCLEVPSYKNRKGSFASVCLVEFSRYCRSLETIIYSLVPYLFRQM